MKLVRTLYDQKGLNPDKLPPDLRASVDILLAAPTGTYNETLDTLDYNVFQAIKKLAPSNKKIIAISNQFKLNQAQVNNDGFNTILADEATPVTVIKEKRVPKDLDTDLGVTFGQKFKDGKVIVAHGTSSNLLPQIYKEGLKRGKGKSWENTSDNKLFFETEPTYSYYGGNVYAWKATQKHGGVPVVLYVKIDKSLLKTDRDDSDLGPRYQKLQKECTCDIAPEDVIGLRVFAGIEIKREDFIEFYKMFADDPADKSFSKGGEFKNDDEYLTIWSKNKGSNYWLLERSHTKQYAMNLLGIKKVNEPVSINGREYILLPVDFDPNLKEQDIKLKQILLDNKTLYKILRTDEAMDLLDSDKELSGSTWTEGACYPLALALHKIIGGELKMVVDQTGKAQHVMLKVDEDKYVDGDGISSGRQKMNILSKYGFVKGPRIVNFDENSVVKSKLGIGGKGFVEKIIKLLKKTSAPEQLASGGKHTLLAPNGAPTNLTPKQWHLVRTPEFKAWFGDWENNPKKASKVVDENGEPMVMYHGGDFNGEGEFDGIAWFTSSFISAENYASQSIQGNVISAFISANNPYYAGLIKGRKVVIDTNDVVLRILEDKKKKLIYKVNSKYCNYDSVIDFLDEYNLDCIVFNSTQIKLADGSNTTFSTNNPDVRFEDGGQVLLAPNAQPTNLTAEQWHTVRTPEFKVWFGDWENDPENASKVLDENSEPLVVYHGTLADDFTVFNTDSELGAHFGNIKQANYITERKRRGMFYIRGVLEEDILAGQNIKPCFLFIKNPLRIDDLGTFSDPPRLYDELLVRNVISQHEYDGINKDSSNEEVKALIISKGYDGIVYLNENEGLAGGFRLVPSGDSWIAFSPNQIKSAISNTTFNPKNPDMRFKQGGIMEATPGLLSEIDNLLGFSIEEFIPENKLPKPAIKLEDYGEKIGGAKKDLRERLKDISSNDLFTEPLSKIFPVPDYKKLVAEKTITQGIAILLKYLYDSIPTKPRKTYYVKSWVNKVQAVINLFQLLVGENPERNKEITDAYIKSMMYNEGGSNRYEMYSKTLKGLGFPENDVKLGKYAIRHFETGWRMNDKMQKEKIDERYTIVSGFYIVQDYATMEDAIEGLRMLITKAKDKLNFTVFGIYEDRRLLKDKFFIGKKTATEVIRVVEGFPTSKETVTFLRENREQVQALWDAMHINVEERRLTNRDRIGTDWRKGKNISSEDFAKTFGFRGVEFGNWVNHKERQDHVNEAFDSLMDLTSLTGLTPNALSLNGELAFAFGARGSGNANAHYEPDKVVINLTKTRGAGSLGHEWWHSLDNYFSRARGFKNDYITESPRPRYLAGLGFVDDSRLRMDMISAYKGVMGAINDSKLPNRSSFLDRTKTKLYWSTAIEMSARSFENFLINKMAAAGQQNDYLANFKEFGEWVRDTRGNVDAEINYPYPLPTESPAIDLAYQQFFDTIKIRRDESGRDVLYEQGGEIEEIPDTMNTSYDKRVIENMKYIGSEITDWRAVPISGTVSTPGPKGKMVEMPVFDFPKGYKKSKTLYKSSQGNECCELCGHMPLKRLFWIQNDKEKTTLSVGSECVGYFGEGKTGKENLRDTKIELAKMLDRDLTTLSGIVKEKFSHMKTEYGYYTPRQVRAWDSMSIDEDPGFDNSKVYAAVKDMDLNIMFDQKRIEKFNKYYGNQPDLLKKELTTINWATVYSKIPVFSWENEMKEVARQYISQESAEKRLLTWFKKNEAIGRELIEKTITLMKILGKYEENLYNSEYLSAVNTV